MNGVKENGEGPAKKVRTDAASPVTNGSSSSESGFQFDTTPNLEDIRKIHENFCNERNWNRHHTPRNLVLAMVGEVGELAECFQWKGECEDGLPDWSAEERTHLEEEMSDVLIYLIRLADKCQINLPKAVLRKVAMNGVKYPANRVNGSAKKYTAYVTKDDAAEEKSPV